MFLPFTVNQDMAVNFMTISLTPVDDKAVFVFVGDANAHHSWWSESVSLTDRHGHDALDFCNLSGCEQLVHCPTQIAEDLIV